MLREDDEKRQKIDEKKVESVCSFLWLLLHSQYVTRYRHKDSGAAPSFKNVKNKMFFENCETDLKICIVFRA